jgi:hypothetical protein
MATGKPITIRITTEKGVTKVDEEMGTQKGSGKIFTTV